MADTSVVIVAAGPGRRMRAYSPKSLIGLPDGRTVVQRQVELARQVWPGADVVVVVGYQADRLAKALPAGCRVVENERFEDTGTARSALLGVRATSTPRVVVMFGDLVFEEGALRSLQGRRSAVLVDPARRPGCQEPGATVADGKAVAFGFGLGAQLVGAVVLAGRELQLFKQLAAGPERDRLVLFEVLDQVVDRRGEFLAAEPAGKVVRIDQVADLKRAKEVAV